jgi:hypothetical protein
MLTFGGLSVVRHVNYYPKKSHQLCRLILASCYLVLRTAKTWESLGPDTGRLVPFIPELRSALPECGANYGKIPENAL